MANSVFVVLGNGIVDILNAQTFSLAAEAQRSWRARKTIASTEHPSIEVVPQAKSTNPDSRATRANVVQVGVVVMRQHGGVSGEEDPVAREDEIALLAQEVEDYLTTYTVIVNQDGEAWTATPTGEWTATVAEDWLDDGIFAVSIAGQYTIPGR